MTVWAVNLTNDDTSAALQYGDIRHVNLKYVYGDEIINEEMPAPVYQALQKAADEFDTARDYLLIIGDHLQLVAFASLIKHRPFRVLRWDKKAEGYISCWV